MDELNSKEYVDTLYGMVRDTETKMQELQLAISVEMGRLSWALHGRPPRMRILCDGEPLMMEELYKVEEFYRDLPELFLAAKNAAQIENEKIENVKDTLERLKVMGIEKPNTDLFKKD